MRAKYLLPSICFYAGVLFMTGCSHHQYPPPQSSISINVSGFETATLIRSTATEVARENGLDYETEASNAEYLKTINRFNQLNIKREDESWLSVGNILKPECVNLSAYMADGAVVAEALTAEIADRLKDELGDEIEIFPGPDCKVP